MKSKSTQTKNHMQVNCDTRLQNLKGTGDLIRIKLFTLAACKSVALFLILLFSVSIVKAQVTSTATGGAWSSTGTWVGNVVPTAGQSVIIATTGGNSVSITANLTQTGSGSVTVNSGATLNMTTTSVDITLGALTVNSGGTVTVYRDFIVPGATNISGTINFGSTSSTNRLMTFTGDVTLNSGAVWNETTTGAVASFSFGGNFTNNATTFSAQNDAEAVHIFTGASRTLSGTTVTSIPYVTISGTRTNNGTLNVGAILTGASTLTNGATGILNIGGTSPITTLTATAAGNVVNYTGAAQTCKVTTYDNLTLSGSGAKTFATTPTVNGVLSLEGTASVVITTGVVTYNTNATLRYNKPGPYTATSEEWITPFAATGGVIIANAGAITIDAAKVFNASVPLNINSGATLVTNNLQLTLGGNFVNGGTLTAGSSPIVIANNMATQSIAGFTTTGLVSMTKTGGTATLLGNVNGAGCTFNGTGGTLNFGAALTHTFTGDLTLSAGTLNCGSSTLRLAGGYSGTGVTFISGSGTVDWNASGPQAIPGGGYYNLTFSGSGTKTVPASTTVAGNLTISGSAAAAFSGTSNTANALFFGASQQVAGTWGFTGSGATNTNTTFFSGTAGFVTVATGSCTPPAVGLTVGGAGPVCTGSGTNITVALSESGVNYQLRNGVTTVGAQVTGTGGTISLPSGNLTSATTFNVFATNTTSGCSAQLTGTAAITINAPPDISLEIGGAGAVCLGSSTNITVALSESGVNYQLRNGTTLIGAPVLGTGATINLPTGNLTSAVTFNVLATNAATTSCSAQLTGTAVITINPLPSVAAIGGGAATVCVNSTTSAFTNATGGGVWSIVPVSGGSASITSGGVVTGLSAGSVAVTYTVSSGGCSNSATQGLIVNASPTVTPVTGTATISIGSSTILASTPSGGIWTSGTPTVAIVNSSTGEVTGVSAGASLISYTVTNGGGCANSATLLVTVSTVSGIEDLQDNNGLTLKNHPNPFTGNTTISYTLPSDGRVTLTLRNLAGQVIKTIVNEMETEGDYTLNIELGDLQSGVYFGTLSLKSNGKEVLKTIRLVKGN